MIVLLFYKKIQKNVWSETKARKNTWRLYFGINKEKSAQNLRNLFEYRTLIYCRSFLKAVSNFKLTGFKIFRF